MLDETSQHAGEGFAGEVEMAGDVAFEAGQFDGAMVFGRGLQEVAGHPARGVAEHDVAHQVDQVVHPRRHAGHHAQAEFVVVFEQFAKRRHRQQSAGGGLDGLRAGRALQPTDGRHFGEGAAGSDHVQHVFLAAGSGSKNPHQPLAHHVDSGAIVAFAEDVVRLGEPADPRHHAKALKPRFVYFGEHRAVGENVYYVSLCHLSRFIRFESYPFVRLLRLSQYVVIFTF